MEKQSQNIPQQRAMREELSFTKEILSPEQFRRLNFSYRSLFWYRMLPLIGLLFLILLFPLLFGILIQRFFNEISLIS